MSIGGPNPREFLNLPATPTRARDERRDTSSAYDYETVERQLLPILRELSRRGVIVLYDSGVEPRTKSRENEQPPAILGSTLRLKPLTDAQTALFSFTLNAGRMVSGRITYAIRASDGTDHQSLIGSLLFAAVNKAGTIIANPNSTPVMADEEIYAASSGTLSTLWAITASGSVATVHVTPSGSLTEQVYGIEYTVELFPAIAIVEV